jgi:uncharacterized protein YaiL (DUF2058 family)
MEAVHFKLFRLPEEADRQLSKEEQEQAKETTARFTSLISMNVYIPFVSWTITITVQINQIYILEMEVLNMFKVACQILDIHLYGL